AADVDVEAAAAAVERRAALRAPEPTTKRPQKRVRKVEPEPEATHRFIVVLEAGPRGAGRALQGLLTLGEHGRVVSSDPTQAEIEREDAKIGSRLIVEVHSDRSEVELVGAINAVPELGSITSESLVLSPHPGPLPEGEGGLHPLPLGEGG